MSAGSVENSGRECNVEITFLGAAGTVTGSKYLVQTQQGTLLVDCGLFQGLKQLRLRNREPFPVDPATIDVIVLTHAHLDHSGYLPVLVREGFRGPVFCTPATADLAAVLLRDSTHRWRGGRAPADVVPARGSREDEAVAVARVPTLQGGLWRSVPLDCLAGAVEGRAPLRLTVAAGGERYVYTFWYGAEAPRGNAAAPAGGGGGEAPLRR
jgi:hypothetical protein